ncbi:prepilin peptidase [Sinimarinibacterium sp. NLF-5-8]|uniref:prepilin peptidase n=1 Tax=Sinimarinibacterium sp. NLF-5-8 TaxID=2698684 RepID=UPI00137B9E02|nr:prepilin peptidase [Sinimarinibacterium sp. NLF-5-8]QHS09062.1 prepilin peptidase [Sinimarinibacterium sp. NLF-5-8]
MHTLTVAALSGFLFACFGSFIGVMIDRIPKGQSIVYPPSACSHCNTPIKPWHNIPLAGFLMLKGKCASCSAKIPLQLFWIEAISFAVGFGLGLMLPG